ncbi:glutathione S-transferase [Rhizobium freirei PRF 81]|uniref:Glutathione S-transferase n=1 Tax=Rhizobium freirei PRF 81 TaxID=363754 RepID=N6V2S1_9HYPH|nr:glutathione S-transferase family protein [Rhizobium freirei]ENN85397.1 glutathione S-transferase [Rhizobium freirei PRF 81]
MGMVLYELAGREDDQLFSPHCWKVRMALAHKGLTAESRPWRFTEKDAIAFSGQGHVPVLVDGTETVSDSWRIAQYLEVRYPDTPSLFGGDAAVQLAAFVNAWADKTLLPLIARIILRDIHDCLAPVDQAYFRTSREKRFGESLEAVVADRMAHLAALRSALSPLRYVLRERAYLSGPEPAYADYCVFGMFMWARCSSPAELLEADDPVFHWRDRLLDAFGGLARYAPHVPAEGARQ